ncbi:DUF3263 domain-containing protein [Microbacterium halotolerans]|uniref:DUF3263 domain-containing protein n=1 Tax=Microbacterium halotolerans TaxID=246613 RepID=UPI0013C36A84|nr:DUF3263 domain-containing protein [Microbacterium halotolerans]
MIVHRRPAFGGPVVPCCGVRLGEVPGEALSSTLGEVTCSGTYAPLSGGTDLTVAQLLDVERRFPKASGAKDEHIRLVLGTNPAHYYVLLSRAIWTDAALQQDPVFARHLREQQGRHNAARAARLRPRNADYGAEQGK